MKNTVRILTFLLILAGIYYLFYEKLDAVYLGYISIFMSLTVIFISFVIFLENRHPAQTLTWIVVLGGFPVVGFIFYLLFGRNKRKEKMFRRKYFLDKKAFSKIEGDSEKVNKARMLEMEEDHRRLFTLAQKLGNSPISFATSTKVLTNGDETFSHILEELKKAAHHIHMEYYIVRHDKIGEEIKEVLISKARKGVKVRFLFDSVGSWKLSKKYIADLSEAGVEVVEFGPVRLPFLNSKFNFRNHRKIIVIDGTVGFVGA